MGPGKLMDTISVRTKHGISEDRRRRLTQSGILYAHRRNPHDKRKDLYFEHCTDVRMIAYIRFASRSGNGALTQKQIGDIFSSEYGKEDDALISLLEKNKYKRLLTM